MGYVLLVLVCVPRINVDTIFTNLSVTLRYGLT